MKCRDTADLFHILQNLNVSWTTKADLKSSKRNLKATGVGGYESKWQDYDCILVGPQVRFKIPEMKEKVKIPVAQIETLDYGLQNVDNMLKLAYSLVESSND